MMQEHRDENIVELDYACKKVSAQLNKEGHQNVHVEYDRHLTFSDMEDSLYVVGCKNLGVQLGYILVHIVDQSCAAQWYDRDCFDPNDITSHDLHANDGYQMKGIQPEHLSDLESAILDSAIQALSMKVSIGLDLYL